MTIRDWSTTPGSNNAAPPNGWPEGQAPSSVNNVGRQMMADLRETLEALPFFDFGHDPTRIDNDTLTVATDLTAMYVAGRRLKLVGATTGYATIASSSYSAPDTTVNVTMDSGNVPTSLLTVSLGPDTATGAVVPYFSRTAAEIAAAVTPTNYLDTTNYLVLDRYGPDKTGATSSHAAWTKLTQVMAQHTRGGQVLINPGDYLFTTQATLTPLDEYRFKIDAYGATFTTTGALRALVISGGTTNGGFTINGLQWKHLSDLNAVAGIEIVGTARTRLNDCHSRVAGVSSTYAHILLRNTDPADTGTGSYWTEIRNFTQRRNSSGDGTRSTLGIVIRGAANATRIFGGELGDCTTVVKIEPESGQTYIANGVLIDGVAFESFATAVLCSQATTGPIGGLRITNNRFEPSEPGTVLSLTGATSQPPAMAYLSGNYMTPDISTYINNPNGLYFISYDSCTNPAIAPTLDMGGAMTLRNRSGGGHGLDVTTGLNGSGIIFRDQSGTQNLTIRSQASGIVELLGSGTDTIKMYGLAFSAFDQSATGQRILRGSGSPESVVTAAIGACYFDLTNGVAYMKKSGTGNTGWKLVTQAA